MGEALAEAAKARPGQLAVDVLDVLAPARPRWSDHLAHLYEPIIVHAPWLWTVIYAATNSPLGLLVYRALAGQSLVRRVLAAAEAQPPDAVVSVHPLMGRAAVAARRRSPFLTDKPIVTVVTDLVDVHRVWVADGVDHYVAGTEAAAAMLMGYGVAPQRLRPPRHPPAPQYGRRNVPMTSPGLHDPAGSDDADLTSQTEMRRQLDLDPELPLVLFMGGGAGAGSLVKRVRAVAALAQHARARVSDRGHHRQQCALSERAGRDHLAAPGAGLRVRAVYSRPDDCRGHHRHETRLGHGQRDPRRGAPLGLEPPDRGQEAGNIPYVVQGQAGFYAPSPQEAADAIALLLQQPDLCWEMGQRAARLGAPDATRRTLDLIQSLVARPSPP